MKTYVVYTSGPTIGGRVALFDSCKDAEEYCSFKNTQSMFSQTSTKDERGISKAWLMGDGMYSYKEEDIPFRVEYFEWG